MKNTLLHYARFMMFVTGLLPPDMVKSKKRLYLVYGITAQILHALLVVSLCLQIPVIRNDGSKLMDAVNLAISFTLMVIKVYIIKSNNFQNLIYEMVSADKKIRATSDKEILNIYEVFVRRSKVIQLFYNIFGCSSVNAFLIPYFVKYIVLWDEEKNNSTVERSLPYQFWFPFKEDENYLISYFINVWFCVFSLGYFCIVQELIVILPLYVNFRLQVLHYFLKNEKKYSTLAGDLGTTQGNNETADTVIRLCLYEHLRIIRFTESLKETIKYLIMLEFVLSSAQLALLLFEIMTSKVGFVSPISHITVLLAQILLLYSNADEIRENSAAICQTLYEADWPEFNKDTKIAIQIMMIRAQRPLVLTIGPFGAVTLETLVTISKAAYTYITFIHRNYGGPKS